MSRIQRRPSGYPYEPPRPRSPWAWGGAILLLGTLVAGLIGAAALLWRHLDVDSLLQAATGAPPPAVVEMVAEVPLPELTTTVSWTAHLYVPEHNAGFFPEPHYHSDLTERWGALLIDIGAGIRHVRGAAALDSLRAGELLVIPAAVCLDDDERSAIRRHVDRGGHLLATWALGARDAECEWVGFRFLKNLTDADAAGTLAGEPPTYMALPHGSVLAAGLPPGLRIELKTEPWITLRSGSSGIFWTDWALNPLGAPGGGAAGAAIARTDESGARIVWFGWRMDVAASERDQRLIERVAQNSALWAAGHLLAEVEPWPGGYRAAMAVTQDVEHSFRNSRRLAERFDAMDVPVTFYVVTQLAADYPEMARVLLAAGEVGTHGVDHRQIAGRLWGMQLAGLGQARDDVAGWTGVPPLGVRPPRELFDNYTLEAWRRSGGLYLAASNGARTAAPEIFDSPAGPVVVLPRVVDDDYTVMVTRGARSPDSLQAALLGALEKMRSLGGLDLVTLHTQLIDSDRRVDAVESTVRAAQAAGDVWIARASDIAVWWLARSGLELQVRERVDHSAVLSVRNSGADTVAAAWLHVYLPEERATYAAPEIGEIILESEYGPWGLRVKLPALAPGESLDILLPRRSA
ncbi:MAG: polysaccharide deacetylase family protein [Gemmatimonadota bacterium]